MISEYNYQDIIAFWFDELTPKQWWEKSDALDAEINERFGRIHHAATLCELWFWRQHALGRLAEVIVLDQFSRNMYRDLPQSFAWDSQALALAQEAVAVDADKELSTVQRSFLYMPYMHSESAQIHEQAVDLFRDNGVENNYQFELKHKAIIDRFGRYPHRNVILGRDSTAEELEFLQQPGSSF